MAKKKLSFDSTETDIKKYRRVSGAGPSGLPPPYRTLETWQDESAGTGMQQSRGRAGEGAKSTYGMSQGRKRRRDAGQGRYLGPEGS